MGGWVADENRLAFSKEGVSVSERRPAVMPACMDIGLAGCPSFCAPECVGKRGKGMVVGWKGASMDLPCVRVSRCFGLRSCLSECLGLLKHTCVPASARGRAWLLGRVGVRGSRVSTPGALRRDTRVLG